jgi:predicted XRE-type DNA-binding protein
MKKREPDYENISSGVVGLLCDRGMNLTQIAELLGVTRSYISRVKGGTRSFTLDHLVTLQRKTEQPLPLLLLQATPANEVPRELKALHCSTEKILSAGAGRPAQGRSRRLRVA